MSPTCFIRIVLGKIRCGMTVVSPVFEKPSIPLAPHTSKCSAASTEL